MLEGVGALDGAGGLLDLAADEPGERAGLDPDGLGAEVGEQVGRAGEQVVAGEDRAGVVPPDVRGLAAAPDGRLVHDVVVVQRAEVGEFDDDRGRDEPGRGRVAEVRGERDQHGPEALAAGLDEVLGRLVEQRVVAADRVEEQFLDGGQEPSAAGRELRVHGKPERAGLLHGRPAGLLSEGVAHPRLPTGRTFAWWHLPQGPESAAGARRVQQ